MCYIFTTIIFGIKEITIKPSKCPIVTGVLLTTTMRIHIDVTAIVLIYDWCLSVIITSIPFIFKSNVIWMKNEVSQKVQENVLLIGVFHSVSQE